MVCVCAKYEGIVKVNNDLAAPILRIVCLCLNILNISSVCFIILVHDNC